MTDAKSSDEVRRCLPLIKDLTDLHTKYSQLALKCFPLPPSPAPRHHTFREAIDEAFKSFLSTNVGGFGMPELLAYYCDDLIRKSKATNTELERELDKLVKLFSYLEDKDLFHESYRRFLSKRLLKEAPKSGARGSNAR